MGYTKPGYKIGLYLDSALKQKNMIPSDFAKFTGIDKDLINKYLINKRSPSTETLEIISNALELPIEYFIVDRFDKLSDSFTESEDGYVLNAHIANVDLMLNVKKGDEKSSYAALKTLQKFNGQIFNTLTPDGKDKMIKAIYHFLINNIYPIAYEEKNGSG